MEKGGKIDCPQNGRMDYKMGMSKNKICMFGLIVIVMMLFVLLGWMIRNHIRKDSTVGIKDDAFLLLGQEEVILYDGYIYYCDLTKERALCRYHLETKETQMIKKGEGILKKTSTGVYYFSDSILFRICGDELNRIWEFSEKNTKFVDVCEEDIYYVMREQMNDDGGEGNSRIQWSVCMQSLTEDETPKKLFSVAEAIRDVVIKNSIAYVITKSGVYSVNAEGETVKLCETMARHFFCDGDTLLFDVVETDGEVYYEILFDGTVNRYMKKRGDPNAVFDGTLYYLYESWLWSKELEATSDVKKVSKLPGYPWLCMDISEKGIVIRQYLQYNIWFYDFETGNIECVIPQKMPEEGK